MKEDYLPISQLLLDPNNYRFQDTEDWVRADPTRLGEESVQQRAYTRIKPEGINELVRSIITNGFLPIERLVVRKYRDGNKGDRFLVLEGNRRLAALRQIQEHNDQGVPTPPEVLEVLDAVPVVVVDPEDQAIHTSLMGIRHVGGIKQWGGYQRAKLVTELKDEHNLSSGEVADRLGMTAHEVNRRYRAFKALEQMLADEEYAEFGSSKMYPIFHEAVSVPQIKEWLKWDDVAYEFKDIDSTHQFYDLIVGHQEEGDDGADLVTPPKISSYSEVRELKSIIKDEQAFESLLDPRQSWSDAIALAKADDLSRAWRRQVAEATTALRGIGALGLPHMEDADLAIIRNVRDVAAELLNIHEKLQNAST